MQIVIDISENDYRKVQDGRASVSMMLKAIRKGTPLPKGHGRLIDADKFECITFQNKSEEFIIGAEQILAMMDDAPTIIEADKGESEDKEEQI